MRNDDALDRARRRAAELQRGGVEGNEWQLLEWASRELALEDEDARLRAIADDRDVTLEDIGIWGMVSRIDAPGLLAELWADGVIQDHLLPHLVPDAWAMCEYPEKSLDYETWHELFTAAGYTVNGAPAPRRVEPVRVYRGATLERRDMWSWTIDRDVAQKFADGIRGRAVGVVWTMIAPQERILAEIHDGRGEAEVVIDPTGLDVRPA